MMKYWAVLIVAVAMASLLFACSEPNTDPTETEPSSEQFSETVPQSAAHSEPTEETAPLACSFLYEFNELGFSLTFPSNWEGRFTVAPSAQAPTVTVTIDGASVFSIASDPNAEGAMECAEMYYAEGYQYFSESLDRTFYLKLDGAIPEDLSWNSRGPFGADSKDKADVMMLFSVPTVSDNGFAMYSQAWTTLVPAGNEYRSDRLGCLFTFPEEWAGRYVVVPYENSIGIYVADLAAQLPPQMYPRIYHLRVQSEDPSSILSEAELSYYTLVATQGGREYYLRIPDEEYTPEEIERYAPLLDDPMARFPDYFTLIP